MSPARATLIPGGKDAALYGRQDACRHRLQ